MSCRGAIIVTTRQHLCIPDPPGNVKTGIATDIADVLKSFSGLNPEEVNRLIGNTSNRK
jgi:hypothetical protein